jgi:3-oxoacyl-[acyl-carrier protein] reductase
MGILEGKVAVVTGASRGVGAAIARSLAEAGAAVVVNYLKSESCAEEVARDIRKSGGDALDYRADITDEVAVGEVVRAAADAFGAVDVPVNNALPDYKVDPVARKHLAHIGWDDYLQQLGALRGALYCAQAVVSGMVEKGVA